MSAFHSRLIVDAYGGLPYVLTSPLIYESDTLKRTVTVPEGFRTDLASVPRILWNILPPMGSYSPGAVVHDYLYQHNGVTRADADAALREAMGVCAVSRWARWVIYAGVRVGGGAVWARYRAS